MFRNNISAAYVLFVGLPLLVLLGVLESGSSLPPPVAVAVQQSSPASSAPAPLNLIRLVIQIGVVLAVSRLVGALFRKIGQPQVVGEMVAGILLGPSLLGWAAPALSNLLFPAASLGYLNALSQVGLVLFMFLIGVFLDPAELRNHGYAALLTSHVSIVTCRSRWGPPWRCCSTGRFPTPAARMAGIPWRDATSLGILMNTRGLMELIALNIGLDIGVISQTVFTIMVLMALVTTFMTSPLLEWAYPSRLMAVEGDRAAEHVA